MKGVEACAVAGMISILATVVATLLAVITGTCTRHSDHRCSFRALTREQVTCCSRRPI